MKTKSKRQKISLKKVIGKGYSKFWNYKGRYRVVKGSRASKKSKTMALWTITNLVKYPMANMLCVRKTARTLQASQYTELKWAIHRLQLDAFFHCTLNPLEITYLPTGQKIYFRGLDDPLKVTSITVEIGYLCWLWVEEAYEITKEADFDILDESIRGETPGCFKQITLTFNPWNEHHWLKKRFFDVDDPDILALTTNYLINEFLDEADKRLFKRMKKQNPRRYQVAGLGDWGIVDGLVFENWIEEKFDIKKIQEISGIKHGLGLDFGFTNDPTAMPDAWVDDIERVIYIYDELYEYGMVTRRIAEAIKHKNWQHEKIRADGSEPRVIYELRDEHGINKIKAARKGPDSIRKGIDTIQDYKIVIHPRCVNFITEISNYQWDTDKFGKKTNKPIDDFNHLMDALRYGMEDIITPDSFSFD